MLYFFLSPLSKYFGALRVFNYISFRSAGAAVTALLLTFLLAPMIIRRLERMKLHQVIREGTPAAHQEKSGTPTMGGIIIVISIVIPTLLWARLSNRYVMLALVSMLWMGLIGMLDDYLKLQQKAAQSVHNTGLVEKYKLGGQVALGVALGCILAYFPISTLPGASTTVPFYKYILIVPISASMAWIYILFVTFVITGATNAVNISDGLDGLAAGLVAIAMLSFAVFAYVIGRYDASQYLQLFYLRGAGELTVFCMATVGACIGFLWFNKYKAEVFMGDTGSLALGGALSAVAILLKSEFLLLIIGGVFVAEMGSVILQRYVFKYRRIRYGRDYAERNKVFRRAPLHHHFEDRGWSEPTTVVRFWILGILFAFLALGTIKLR